MSNEDVYKMSTLRFLNKEYAPTQVKEEIRLSLQKESGTYYDNESRPLETYTEKLYILCQDGNIELHTRILVESGRTWEEFFFIYSNIERDVIREM